MGHVVENDPYPGTLEWSLLGMLDHQHEMRLIVQETVR